MKVKEVSLGGVAVPNFNSLKLGARKKKPLNLCNENERLSAPTKI